MELRKYEIFMILALFAIAILAGAADMKKLRKEIALKGSFFISLVAIILWALTPNAGVDVPEIGFVIILCLSGYKAYRKDLREVAKVLFKEPSIMLLKVFLRKIL